MGFFDSIMGRTKPAKANLDNLFAIPSAAITLSVSANLVAKGAGAVCFKPASGAAFENTSGEFEEVLRTMQESGGSYREENDSFGYRWIVVQNPSLEDLVIQIHLINRTLEDHGFSPQLLCSVFRFEETSTKDSIYWVYLYKRGTYYPFVPSGDQRRDTEKELSLKAIVGSDLPIEDDLQRWFPLWGLPL